jgi:hypothetical protein
MDSSTSHSKKIPRRPLLLLATALASWIGCAFYSLHFNPDVTYYRHGYLLKHQWAEKMTREHGAKTIVYGGSSCEFSIDGERLLSNFSEPVVNYGGHAGMGAVMLTEAALSDVRRGDTLIVALEPGLLTQPLGNEPILAAQFSFAMHHPNWVLHPTLGVGRENWFQAAASLRPGGYLAFTMLGKWLRGQPSYRYQVSDFHPSGWAETPVRVPMTIAPGHGPELSEGGRQLLSNLSRWCQTNGVRVAYALPWAYCPPNEIANYRKLNAEFLADIMTILPVLRDDSLGADPDAGDYADTGWHLTRTAAERRSDEFGRQIQKWDMWTREKLDLAITALPTQ